MCFLCSGVLTREVLEAEIDAAKHRKDTDQARLDDVITFNPFNELVQRCAIYIYIYIYIYMLIYI